jgi:hypothetical protein
MLRTMKVRTIVLVALVLVVGLAGGCGNGQPTRRLAASKATCPNDVGEGPTGVLKGMRLAAPPSLDAMKAAADTIVRVTASETVCTEMEHELPITVRTVNILEVLEGDGINVGDSIEVRQSGSPRMPFDDSPPFLTGGSEYVLYLETSVVDGVVFRIPVAGSGVFAVVDGAVAHLDPRTTFTDAEKKLPLKEWRAKVTAG